MRASSKERLFRVALVLVFLLGALGHLWLRTPPEAEAPVQLSLTVEGVSAYLAPSLPKSGEEVTLLSRIGTVTAVSYQGQPLTFREGGETLFGESRLFLSVFFTVCVPARVKEERLYLGERMLLVGDEVLLLGKNAAFLTRLTGF